MSGLSFAELTADLRDLAAHHGEILSNRRHIAMRAVLIDQMLSM